MVLWLQRLKPLPEHCASWRLCASQFFWEPRLPIYSHGLVPVRNAWWYPVVSKSDVFYGIQRTQRCWPVQSHSKRRCCCICLHFTGMEHEYFGFPRHCRKWNWMVRCLFCGMQSIVRAVWMQYFIFGYARLFVCSECHSRIPEISSRPLRVEGMADRVFLWRSQSWKEHGATHGIHARDHSITGPCRLCLPIRVDVSAWFQQPTRTCGNGRWKSTPYTLRAILQRAVGLGWACLLCVGIVRTDFLAWDRHAW